MIMPHYWFCIDVRMLRASSVAQKGKIFVLYERDGVAEVRTRAWSACTDACAENVFKK